MLQHTSLYLSITLEGEDPVVLRKGDVMWLFQSPKRLRCVSHVRLRLDAKVAQI